MAGRAPPLRGPLHPGARQLGQPELFFSIITPKVIKRGNFTSRADLVSKLMRSIASYNETAKPFAWTYSGQPLKVAAEHARNWRAGALGRIRSILAGTSEADTDGGL